MGKLDAWRQRLGRIHYLKYIVTLAVFGVIVVFLDENSLIRRMSYAREAARLRGEIGEYMHDYEEDTRRLDELEADTGAVERIAREMYLMKKPDEDIYVFEEDIK